jgi:hypothetical protein
MDAVKQLPCAESVLTKQPALVAGAGLTRKLVT